MKKENIIEKLEKDEVEEIQSDVELNEKDIFNDENEAKMGSFVKLEKVDDYIAGKLSDDPEYKEAVDDFPAQYIYSFSTAIIMSNGKKEKLSNIKFGFPKPKWDNYSELKLAKQGMILGFKFKNTYQTPEREKKKMSPFKNIVPFFG